MPIHRNYIIIGLIVNWNQPNLTIDCIKSLKSQDYELAEIIVVDNGSSDQSIKLIKNEYEDIDIIQNNKNLGFAAGVNIGLKAAFKRGADFAFLINNDAYLSKDTISTLMHHENKKISLYAPMIFYADQPNIIWSIGGKLNKLILEYSKDFRGKKDPGNLPEIIYCDFVTGCCLLIPRDLIKNVGLLDQSNFFMYYEDADWCNRIRNSGLNIAVISNAKAWHKISMSSGGSNSQFERYWMARSSVLYFRKHASRWQLLFILPWRFLSLIKTVIMLLIQGNSKSIKSYLIGIKHGIQANIKLNKRIS